MEKGSCCESARDQSENRGYESAETTMSPNHAGLKSRCATCRFRNYAERKPNSLLARIWRWHTGWCPGWKAYQKELAEQNKA